MTNSTFFSSVRRDMVKSKTSSGDIPYLSRTAAPFGSSNSSFSTPVAIGKIFLFVTPHFLSIGMIESVGTTTASALLAKLTAFLIMYPAAIFLGRNGMKFVYLSYRVCQVKISGIFFFFASRAAALPKRFGCWAWIMSISRFLRTFLIFQE